MPAQKSIPVVNKNQQQNRNVLAVSSQMNPAANLTSQLLKQNIPANSHRVGAQNSLQIRRGLPDRKPPGTHRRELSEDLMPPEHLNKGQLSQTTSLVPRIQGNKHGPNLIGAEIGQQPAPHGLNYGVKP